MTTKNIISHDKQSLIDERLFKSIFIKPSNQKKHGKFIAIDLTKAESHAAGCHGRCKSGTCIPD